VSFGGVGHPQRRIADSPSQPCGVPSSVRGATVPDPAEPCAWCGWPTAARRLAGVRLCVACWEWAAAHWGGGPPAGREVVFRG